MLVPTGKVSIMFLEALTTTADTLNVERCYLWQDGFHFPLRPGLSIVITPDSALRLRVEVFDGLTRRPDTTHWVLSGDRHRLVEVVNDLTDGVMANCMG